MQDAADARAWDPALRWRGLAVVSAAMVISAIDMTIVNVALPDISRELDATLGELQWVLDGFLVALAGMLTVASGIADRFGRRRVFLAGMGGLLLCAVAFLARELSARHPLLDVRILVRPRVAAGVVALLALYASFLA